MLTQDDMYMTEHQYTFSGTTDVFVLNMMLNINFQSNFSGVSGKTLRSLYQYVGH